MTKNSRSVEEEDNKKSRVEMVVDEFWNWNNGDVIRFESLNKSVKVDLQFSNCPEKSEIFNSFRFISRSNRILRIIRFTNSWDINYKNEFHIWKNISYSISRTFRRTACDDKGFPFSNGISCNSAPKRKEKRSNHLERLHDSTFYLLSARSIALKSLILLRYICT